MSPTAFNLDTVLIGNCILPVFAKSGNVRQKIVVAVVMDRYRAAARFDTLSFCKNCEVQGGPLLLVFVFQNRLCDVIIEI